MRDLLDLIIKIFARNHVADSQEVVVFKIFHSKAARQVVADGRTGHRTCAPSMFILRLSLELA